MQILRTDLDARLTALHNCPYFSGLNESTLIELASGMHLAHFSRGETVFWQDEAGAGLHIIRHGSIKLIKISPQGREYIVNIIEDGATFNEVSVFDGQKNPINVVAIDETDIWVIDPQLIRSILASHPEMSQAVILNLAYNLRKMVGILEELSFLQVTHRLARLLAKMTPEQLAGETGTRLTQHQLAARLGTVREVVARSLRELEHCGAIRVNQRQIVILDRALLQEWAQTPPN